MRKSKEYNTIYDAVHDLKRMIPLLDRFIDRKPKPQAELDELHNKIVKIMTDTIVDLCKCLKKHGRLEGSEGAEL